MFLILDLRNGMGNGLHKLTRRNRFLAFASNAFGDGNVIFRRRHHNKGLECAPCIHAAVAGFPR